MELLDYGIIYLLFDLRNKSMEDGVRGTRGEEVGEGQSLRRLFLIEHRQVDRRQNGKQRRDLIMHVDGSTPFPTPCPCPRPSTECLSLLLGDVKEPEGYLGSCRR